VLRVGEILGGRFRVDRLLGAGGMGIVVAATHLELEQHVAIKVLHDELATNQTIVARFLREARAVAQLRTEHVCRVFDVGRLDNGAPFIVMELLEGNDLGSVVVRGPLPPQLAVDYVLQACVALAEAHAAGVVHRDLKPANLFVTRRADGGRLVKVLDFGIAKAATAAEAKLTHTTSTMGSPGYMSPEQIKSARDVDLRTDIWALGVTLYQMLSARMPFPGTQLAQIAVSVATQAPAPLEVDPALNAIVMRCLEKEPEHRYQDVASLSAALRAFVGLSPAPFVPTTAPGPASAPVSATFPTAASAIATQATMPPASAGGVQPRSRTKRWIWLPVGGVIALLGGGLVIASLSDRSPSAQPAAATGSDALGSAVSETPIDAAKPATEVAVQVTVDAGDPWADRPAPPPDPEPPPDPTPPIDDTPPEPPPVARGSGAAVERGDPRMRAHRAQFAQSLNGAESALKFLENDPVKYQEALRGMVSAACVIGDVARSQRYFDRLTDAKERAKAKRECTRQNVPLVERAAPAAKPKR
jgi:serine/threonine-protein kinase